GQWPFPADKVLAGYAYILTHPGIPSIFWDHLIDWGEENCRMIASLLKARRAGCIKVDSPVKIKVADTDLYLAEVGTPITGQVRIALGPRCIDPPDGNYWKPGPSGDCFSVWIHPQLKTHLGGS
ncbi:unnamed protein product, partial [Polarella glacialis]